MKKVKIAFWLLLVAFFGLLIYQDQELFLVKKGLRINLYFTAYQVPEIPNAVYYLAFLVLGVLLSYFATLSGRFKTKKMIKDLRSELDSLKKSPAPAETRPQDAAAETPSQDAAS